MTLGPSVSVIVPVYNGERFVNECLKSISQQKLGDIEIIIVDDGSTDGTTTICRDYVENEPRAKLIRKENAGVSAARNSGLDVALGTYIAFVDADDRVLEHGLLRLLGEAQKNDADIVIGEYLTLVDGRTVQNTIAPVETAEQVLCGLLLGRYHGAFWNKIVRRQLFFSARFPEGIGYMEDSVVLCRLLVSGSPKVSFLNEAVYQYRQHNESVTHSRGRSVIDILTAQRLISEHLTQRAQSREIYRVLFKFKYNVTWFLLVTIDDAYLCEAISLAKLHLSATPEPRQFASADIKSALVKALLGLPQPLATAGVRGLRGILGWLSPARRKAPPQRKLA